VKESADSGSLPTYFERNDAWVIEAFRRGEFDYLAGVGEVSEADFFRAITERKILQKLADTYPSPCQKHDVPLWVYIASDISMRFHGVHPFHAFPYVVRSGGMIQAFGPEMGHKAIHPQTGDVSLRCEGFNAKNEYDRQTPCDQDYLRKMARKTDAQLLQTWFNREVVGIFKQHHAFDPEGIFIGDATYPSGGEAKADAAAAGSLYLAALLQAGQSDPHQSGRRIFSLCRVGGGGRAGSRVSSSVSFGRRVCGVSGPGGDEAVDSGPGFSGRGPDRPLQERVGHRGPHPRTLQYGNLSGRGRLGPSRGVRLPALDTFCFRPAADPGSSP
jgi:hypothetical protein